MFFSNFTPLCMCLCRLGGDLAAMMFDIFSVRFFRLVELMGRVKQQIILDLL